MKMVIVARDGVILERLGSAVRGTVEGRPLNGSLEAIAKLCQAGFRVVATTAPPAEAADPDTQIASFERLQKRLATMGGRLEAVLFGNGRPTADLVKDAARRLQMGLDDVWYVSDHSDGLDSARQVGAHPVLVRSGLGTATAASADLQGVRVFDDLASAAAALISGA